MDGERDDSRYLSVRGILLLLIFGVLVPVVTMSAAGVVAIVLWTDVPALITGILVTSLALATLGATIAILVMISRRSRLVRQQATFVANVTHELRTPLAAIRLHAQTLEMGHALGDGERANCLGTILREAGKLDRLIQRVLEWRLIVERKRPYALVRGSIGDAVDDAVRSFRAVVDPAEIDLAVESKATRVVAIDREAMSGAVLNLLMNAYKYSGEKKAISVATRDVGGGVEVAVRDNGIGIPRAEHERIFHAFHRVDQRLRGRAAGAGLGLAIVWDAARGHGGEVGVVSEPGKGSTFTIFVPAARKEEGAT